MGFLHVRSLALVNTSYVLLGTIDLIMFITGVLSNNAKGMFATDTIYSDNDIQAIEALPPTAWHRTVDLEIVKADTDG
jgi:hypothetical protein